MEAVEVAVAACLSISGYHRRRVAVVSLNELQECGAEKIGAESLFLGIDTFVCT